MKRGRRFRLALWSSVIALHAGGLAATAWVQWRTVRAAPQVLVTVAPPPPPPPKAAAPVQRATPPAPARRAASVRRVAAARRTVAPAARVGMPQVRRTTRRAVRVQATARVVEEAAPPPSLGSPAGAAVSNASTNAQSLDREASPLPGCPSPRYPRSARRRGHTGLVLLRVHLDALGNVLAVLIDRSSGHPNLDDAARNAVLRWRFAPRVRGGTAVPCELLQPVDFALR